MNVSLTKILIHTLVIFKYLSVLQKDEVQRWTKFCSDDYINCPNCFDGNSNCSCDTFLNNVKIENEFEMEVNSIFGSRKVQYGMYYQRKIVLKYLVSDGNLDDLKSKCCNGNTDCEMWTNKSNKESLKIKFLSIFKDKENVAGFQICPTDSVERFMKVFSEQSIYAWTLLNLNVEPLITYTLRNRNFSVPTLYNSCGFVTIQSNNGLPLYTFYDKSFTVRLLIAKNLLNAALQFSYGVEGFRIYLTDATPDNIVVDTTSFDVTFIDLDSVFVVDSEAIADKQKLHRHEKIDCEGSCFAYVPEELCSHYLSDINVFAVCQLFVADLNRMPDIGLLHSSPELITKGHSEFQHLINICVNNNIDSDDRLVTAQLLLKLFNKILNE